MTFNAAKPLLDAAAHLPSPNSQRQLVQKAPRSFGTLKLPPNSRLSGTPCTYARSTDGLSSLRLPGSFLQKRQRKHNFQISRLTALVLSSKCGIPWSHSDKQSPGVQQVLGRRQEVATSMSAHVWLAVAQDFW